ncbi:SOS response-associated peptidase family protein [Asticcacaulis sp. YBE204]|uniref:SOS response-associated peptidase family protein n=1 Tax=Asticcacaulis sp. YBE204 TaxID=1282363 RepID=UPI0003C3FB4A|nr:SOS response-associated peptidase family protein [Asticcacaulis sp. YBE204]ESQ78470.1 hypothetical protein AEYBE204_13020 [Asticcacaulis sp. YBE204]
MCNRYRNDRATAALFSDFAKIEEFSDHGRNMPFKTELFPNYPAPIIRRQSEGGLVLDEALWGMPTPPEYLVTPTGKPKSYDSGVTNIRNLKSPHWRRWFGLEHRCLVPFTAFSENHDVTKAYHWFGFTAEPPATACFAGVSDVLDRQIKAKDPAPTQGRFYAFLTMEPNDVVRPVHRKAMPLILTTPEDCRAWLTAPWAEVAQFQKRTVTSDVLVEVPPPFAESTLL